MDEEAARAIAEQFLDEHVRHLVSDSVAISGMHEYEHCWVAYFNTAAFIESGRLVDSLAGNGPIVINRRTQVARQGLSSLPTEDQLDQC